MCTSDMSVRLIAPSKVLHYAATFDDVRKITDVPRLARCINFARVQMEAEVDYRGSQYRGKDQIIT